MTQYNLFNACSIISNAGLYSVFWLKLITSSALYHYNNAERCGVDSVDFIISHFHMNNSSEEAFNLPIYLCFAHK